jgi:hypothetical protein
MRRSSSSAGARRPGRRSALALALATTTGLTLAAVPVGLAASTGLAPAAQAAPTTSSCRLGNGVQHVINITFDNVHFFRDNPNVPSDLEQMPVLEHFLESNGTVLSNMHTPLIAHTAEDSLAIYSGLYGDRHGQPVSNTYHTFKTDGSTETDVSFVYWNSPVINNTTKTPSLVDRSPSMVYSPTVPASSTTPTQVAPEPWVAWNKAGCSVGAFSTANMVLENNGDIPTVFGSAPPLGQYANNTSAFIGEAIHCGIGDASCNDAGGAVTDTPPPSNHPGSAAYKGLFGHKFVQPFIDAHATAPAPYQVHNNAQTDGSDNLVDLDNAEIADFNHHPGFPGFSPTPSQSLAMLADMQEAGVPVTYGYIADMHERKDANSNCTTATATSFGRPLGPGDSCYVANAKTYDAAFAKFLDRLAKDGITPDNTLFVIGAEENDHLAGANVGRARQPTPAGCDGVSVPCNYAAGQVGELEANLPSLLSKETSDTTPFDVEPQGASIYVHGQPGKADPQVRQLERDLGAIKANNPYSGVDGEKIINYQAGTTEERILHLQTADPQRTPTVTVFPKPDYYFDPAFPSCASSTNPARDCAAVFPNFAWNHGYYSPDIDVTWSSFVGPGVRAGGVDGEAAADSPQVRDPNGGGSVPAYSTKGTWADETDVRPTMLYLAGLHDDYVMDGRVITQLVRGAGRLSRTTDLGSCYKQLNASVGEFGTDTLVAATAAQESGSAGDDSRWTSTDQALSSLADRRDALATDIKDRLDAAEFHGALPDPPAEARDLGECRSMLSEAAALAAAG